MTFCLLNQRVRLSQIFEGLAFLIFVVAAQGSLAEQVQVTTGWLEGLDQAGVSAFLGIPYAAPPVGPLRWKAPRDPAPWTGVRPATELKSPCAQLGNLFSTAPLKKYGKPFGSEDCLYLNVWNSKAPQASLKPIVFFIHGGSNSMGTINDPNYDGTRFSKETQTLIVTVGYRLGFLGSFYSSFLSSGNPLDDSGNQVTLDLLKALQWVQTNAAAFGADPNNITIMGQSAGCINVWGLLQSPLAKGKFQKAVCLSGLPNAYPTAVAEIKSQSFIARLLLRDGLAATLEAAQSLLAGQEKAWVQDYLIHKTTEDILAVPAELIPIQHVTDGTVLPSGGFIDLTTGKFNRVPLILGTTADEGTLLVDITQPGFSQSDFWKLENSGRTNLSPLDLINVLEYVPFQAASKAASASVDVALDRMSDALTLYLPKLYRSKFTWKDLPSPWGEVFGSFHSLDLMVLLGNFITDRENDVRFAWGVENQSSREKLHSEMIQEFKSFFLTGMPTKDWQPWNKDESYKNFK